MSRNYLRVGIVAVTLASCGAMALAMCGDLSPNFPVVNKPGWPTGLAALLNWPDRVDGYFAGFSEHYLYHGNARSFNDFLVDYAALKDKPLVLVLHPGRGTSEKLWGRDNKRVQAPFEWEVQLLPVVVPGDIMHTIQVDLWLGGDVSLDELDVPENIEVQSGKEIEQFIAKHEANRGAEKAKEAAPKAEAPATPK